MRNLATPYQRPDGRWAVQVELDAANGKRRRKMVYGRTKRECAQRQINVLSAQQNGRHVSRDERATLGAFLAEWIETIGPSLRPRTRRSYADHVRLHIAPALGSVPISKLSADQVQRFLNAKSAAGMAPKTVRHLRATLRAALNQAVEWERIGTNPAARRLRLPALDDPRERINPLTPEQVRHVLDVSARQGHRLHALWVTALYVGPRQGELLALRWDGLSGGTLRIDRSLERIDGRLQLGPTKTTGSVRTVVLPAPVVAALQAHKAAQDQERRRFGWIEHGLIFPTTIGTPMDPRNLIRDWHALTRAAGLPRFRFHDMRHTAATLMLLASVDVNLVAEVLGHKDATMVLRVYGHVLPQQREDAARRMEAMLA